MKLDSPPVKKAAAKAGIPVFQTPTVKSPEAQARLKEFGADVFVVVAFGFILPGAVLQMTRFGCINVHFSSLPLLRGAAPVQRALMQGHAKTGVTIMQLDEGMDTGPVYAREEVAIGPDDNTETLEKRLALLGSELLIRVLDQIEAGSIRPEPQDDSGATLAPKITGDEAHLDWSEPAEAIRNKVRGLTPRPGAWGMLNGKRLKIWKAAVEAAAPAGDSPAAGPPGAVLAKDGKLLVQTGSGRIVIEEVQPEGKARMSAADYLRGYRPKGGDRIL